MHHGRLGNASWPSSLAWRREMSHYSVNLRWVLSARLRRGFTHWNKQVFSRLAKSFLTNAPFRIFFAANSGAEKLPVPLIALLARDDQAGVCLFRGIIGPSGSSRRSPGNRPIAVLWRSWAAVLGQGPADLGGNCQHEASQENQGREPAHINKR
jgi:hypothetical protein